MDRRTVSCPRRTMTVPGCTQSLWLRRVPGAEEGYIFRTVAVFLVGCAILPRINGPGTVRPVSCVRSLAHEELSSPRRTTRCRFVGEAAYRISPVPPPRHEIIIQ